MVYVVQETTHDLQRALRFGPLKVLFPQDWQFRLDGETAVQRARERMRTFTDDDYVLPVGCPVGIAIVASIAAALNHGKYKILKWDGRAHNYWPVSIDLGEVQSAGR